MKRTGTTMASVITALLVLLAGGVNGQDVTDEISAAGASSHDESREPELAAPPTPEPSLSNRVRGLWFEIQPHLSAGRLDAARVGVDELVSIREDRRLSGFPMLARAVVAYGFEAIEDGDKSRGKALFQIAQELDPTIEDPRLGLAAAEGDGAPARVLSTLFTTSRGRLQRLSSMPFALSNWALVTGLGFLIAGILVVVAFLIRHQSTIRHDVEELLKKTGPLFGAAVGWLVLLLPLILLFDLFWAALFWAVLVGAYLSVEERVVISVAVVFCALALPSAALADWLLSGGNDTFGSVAVRHLEGLAGDGEIRQLEAFIAEHPDSTPAQLLLAKIYERNGQPAEALEHYQRMQATNPSAEILNNIGTFYYRRDGQGDKERARDIWKAAIATNSNFAPTHYNLSIYYEAAFNWEKKDEHFNQAKTLAPELINRVVSEGTDLLDAGIDMPAVRSRLLGGGGGKGLLSSAFATPHTLATLVALVLLHALAIRRKGVVAKSCIRCGESFCKDCKPGKDKQDLCLQCVHLFLRKDGVSPQMRAEKLKKVALHQKLRTLTAAGLSLLLPGGGHIFRRRAVAGLVFATLWGFAAAAVLYRGHTLLQPGFVATAQHVAPMWIAPAVAGVVWLLANVTNFGGSR